MIASVLGIEPDEWVEGLAAAIILDGLEPSELALEEDAALILAKLFSRALAVPPGWARELADAELES